MDSFKRSQYSIFNRDKKTPKEKPSLAVEKKAKTPKPKTNILNTDVMGDDKKEKKNILNFIIPFFGLVLVAIFFFSVGYYLKNRLNQPNTAEEIKDVGLVLAEKYGKEEAVGAGEVKISFWIDYNGDGEKNTHETIRETIGANIRREGEEHGFTTIEADGEGIIRISGLDEGKYEVRYYIHPSQYYPNQSDIYGATLYEIVDSSDGATGIITNEWRGFTVGKDGTKITVGLQEYKPEKLIVAGNSYSAVFYDPIENLNYANGLHLRQGNLPPKFEIRDNNIFYIKNGALYKNNPLVNKTYSQRVYDQIAINSNLFYELSPSGKSIIYGDNTGAFFQTPNNECGRRELRYENKPISLYTVSNPHDAVGVTFGSDNNAIIYGQVNSEEYRYYLVSCNNSNLSVKQLPIKRYWFGGIYAQHNRFVLKGPITHEKECEAPTSEEQSSPQPTLSCGESYGEGLYVYLLNEDKVQRIGGSELDTTYFAETSFDSKYALLADAAKDDMYLLNFEAKDNIEIISVDPKPLFKKYDKGSMGNGNFTYIGNDRFLMMDRFGQCGTGDDCVAVKELKINGNNINVSDVMMIKDTAPIKIVGEIVK